MVVREAGSYVQWPCGNVQAYCSDAQQPFSDVNRLLLLGRKCGDGSGCLCRDAQRIIQSCGSLAIFLSYSNARPASSVD